MEQRMKHFTSRCLGCFTWQERQDPGSAPNEPVYIPLLVPLPLHTLQRVQLPAGPPDDGQSASDRKRWWTFSQFVTHEQNYLDALHKLQYELYNPLLVDDAIVDRNVSYAIFGTHRQICRLHQFLQPLLERCVHQWDERNRSIGWLVWAIVGQPALLPLYRSFANGYPDAVGRFAHEMTRNFLFSWFVTGRLRGLGERLSFSDYFIAPVQRLPQLVLELRELCEATPASDPDRAVLERCVQRAVYLAEQLNVARERADLIQRVAAGDGRRCQFLHSELLEETDVDGRPSFTRWRLVVLLSDRLVGVDPAQGDLEWAIPLQELQVDSRPTDGSVCSHDTFGYVRDFQTVTQMRELVCTFYHQQPTLGEGVLAEILDTIWSVVLPAKQTDREATSLQVRGASGKRHNLKTGDAARKQEWLDWIRLARLALHPINAPAWWAGAAHLPQEAPLERPLLVRTFRAGDGRGVWSVSGGCCYVPRTDSPAYTNELYRAWSTGKHILWIGSSRAADGVGDGSSRISLYTHDRTTHAVDERACFTLPHAQVTCLEHVPAGSVGDVPPDTVWIGTRRKLLIYSATLPLVGARLGQLRVKGTPNRLLYSARRLLLGTGTGRLLIFSIRPDGVWDLRTPQQLCLHGGSVEAMVPHRSLVYLAAGTRLHVFDSVAGLVVQSVRSPATTPADRQAIVLLRCTIHGLWIVRHRSSAISLYHARCFKHLLDVDVRELAGPVLANFQLSVTSLAIADDRLLWMGTNAGVVLSMQLPAHASVPIRPDLHGVARHGHLRDVSLILPMPSLRMRSAERVDTVLDPALIDLLYGGTRNGARDFVVRSVGVQVEQIGYIDTGSEGSRCDQSPASGEEEESWSREEREATWAPNSTLIVTGGQGYGRWYPKTTDTSGLGASTDWRREPIDEQENLILWEMRLT
ncbi:rho guanine nucleotide exchange factor 10-like [Anopheles merus]|uniref:DH domain-containing protein n=1 Tax=Anopheles merus TaxID=30066 RepID=A0A182UU08_ANOME|nr:rho guanine nucleotide exchange factor 10-like [Anopheles merus]XP_041761751.1 rho guanine nucleotide exchange factor 10-like [Anopheles merus]XP_041761760.1 rho guanine nucleotide exchange factor 10-like [Anopheles merus]XP_041761769.1 rho guanine nucleotide exchange factor 10-like [Anopheles merus]XP_041761780.1 rho guanine nucleotide exchange factor 10-like [Anopheles merus]XP_041761788.1 rho guanine nucleotide exchange factor 10-like [Anopheles merus]